MDNLVSKFSPITLGEMNAVKLLNRTDTKFVTSTDKLRQLLMLACDDYRILVADGKRISPYYTVYFDTDDLDMFRRHQAGHADRQKLRIRSYVSSQLNFLEIKTKDNHKRTRKQRVTITGFDSTNPPHDITFHSGHEQRFGTCDDFLNQNLYYAPGELIEQIENRFNRITLVNRGMTERLTIDTSLCFHNITTGRDFAFTNTVIIELKRDGNVPSPILAMLRQLRIKPMGFSKYCIGTILTNPHARYNRFKPRLHAIEKIEQKQLIKHY